MPRLTLGPISCTLRSRSEILDALPGVLARGEPCQLVTLNALMYQAALTDPALAAVLSGAAIAVADSVGIAWAASRISAERAERVPGIDLLQDICADRARAGGSVYLLGAAPGVAARAAERLSALYPGLRIAGVRDGYFSTAEDPAVIAAIRAARPDVLFVGLSIPRQELWIARNLSALNVPLVMGIGGSFDVISGDLRRAPAWMRAGGLEWLFRVLQQPWRLARIRALPAFVAHVIAARRSARA